MVNVNVTCIILHLLRLVGIYNYEPLTCVAVAGSSKFGNLPRLATRMFAVCTLTCVNSSAQSSKYIPKLHVLWVWIIIAVCGPFLRGDLKSLAALCMFLLIALMLCIENLVESLPKESLKHS
jgi:hypothetical protein